MKKIALIISILISANLYALDRVECEELFKSAIANFYLENSCKFDKHLSSTIRKEFENQNCSEMFSDDDMKQLNSEVLGSSYKEMNDIGREDFCKNSKVIYDNLARDKQ